MPVGLDPPSGHEWARTLGSVSECDRGYGVAQPTPDVSHRLDLASHSAAFRNGP
ncbi:hypothetical protein SAMN05421541_102478 [Actinoplanes philippinensis]|uniref:Uncharacterized protein n=1 Tax=Actinoplanes philippinensis TaxID=35752 RepID=A0A1I2BR36_9ACTN|nr:hypothetical protein SAMN05421541_102478 [Actinoplanes philippinensis]